MCPVCPVGYEAIVVLDEMPLNATGKIDRVALMQLAADRHDGTARIGS